MPQVNATISTVRNGSYDFIPIDVYPYRDGGPDQYEVQKVTIRAVPTLGTFRLKNSGATRYYAGTTNLFPFETAEIAFDAAGTDIAGAINAGVGKAIGTLTSDNTNVADGDQVVIGNKTYTHKTVLTPAEGEVLIGANADASLLNLIRAINHTGTPGTDYSCAAAHTQVTAATSVTAHAFTITSIQAGTAGNSIATTETSAHLSWGAATLTGGGTGPAVVDTVSRSTVGSTVVLYISFKYYVSVSDPLNWPLTTAISALPAKPLGEIQRIAWDAVPGRGFWFLEDADGLRTDGISFDADDATIAAALNNLLGAGQVAVTQVQGVSVDVRWLLSGDDQPTLDVFTDNLFTADDGGVAPSPSDTKAPIILPVGSLFGVIGSAFTQTLVALNDPDSWTASGVPAGMTFNETTAELSGTPTLIGDFTITARATNVFGTSVPMAFVFTVLPSASAAGGRRLLLDLSQRILAYADSLHVADPLEVSLKDASFVFETINGVIIPGASNPGRLELRAMEFVGNTANFDTPADLLINVGIDITDVPEGKQLIVLGEDWGDADILALFTTPPSDPMSKTLIAQARWRNGDDVAGHYQHSKLFKVNVSNTLFQT